MKKAKRRGKTEKLSISLDEADARYVRALAKRAHGGNVSAVVAEGIDRIREEEGRRALADLLDEKLGPMTEKEMNAVRAEWRGKKRTKAA